MEVVTATPNGGGVPPFHDHDVREWSRIDSITGALERARLETDHWSANTINSSHKYGKVVDLRARTEADGALQQQARRQLEVFQSQIPGGHLQVIKTHKVSSSRWTNKPAIGDGFGSKDFENLLLSHNPLDLSSQKSKASVGRSASRRPPTRQRSREPSNESSNPLRDPHLTAATNLHRVTRLCHQIHESAVRQAFGKRSPPRPTISDRENGDGSVEIYEIESASSNDTKSLNGHSNLSRKKSTSSDDIHVVSEKDLSTKSVEDLEDLEQLQNWRRTSKIRRSLQFPKHNKTSSKPLDLPENSVSVKKIREDLEKGRRLNTALRNNSVDLEALDQILQSISSSSSIHSDKASNKANDIESEQASKKQKRSSFVTVESLKEVKGRLRRTSSPTCDIYRIDSKELDPDDGIVTEETTTNSKQMPMIEKSTSQSRVRSYVYGMEALLNKKPNLGTGSLESRGKLVNNNTNTKNEDWYNRRKSYGFEQMYNQDEPANSMCLKSKNLVESSTDSGICRSTEIVVVPTATKANIYNEDTNNYSSDNNDEPNKYKGHKNKHSNGVVGQVKKMASSFNQDDKKAPYNKITNEELTPKKIFLYKPSDWSNNDKTELKSTTITIPIVKNNNVVALFWNDQPEKEIKRHSIAVDESKYVIKDNNENRFRRTSLVLNDQYIKQEDDDSNGNRKQKKVEFCKTEVHFAAESGKVNIVATDEKPPPTQNFRRRRRITGFVNEDFNKNDLPVLHFGDSSYEKTMFGVPDDLPDAKITSFTSVYENEQPIVSSAFGVVTVNTNNNINNNMNNADLSEEDKKEQNESESIKGILKNKPIKPRPYHLGETVPFSSETNSDEDRKSWGVNLKHVDMEEMPVWKSTVTVHNYYDKQAASDINGCEEDQPEFQKLLKNLRPTRKMDCTSDNRYSDSFSSIKVVPSQTDSKRSSWSITDKTKLNKEDLGIENRGYSTRVNFGEGEATVVESDGLHDKERHPTWSRVENPTKDIKQRLTNEIISTADVCRTTSKYVISNKNNLSPVVLNKAVPVISKPDLKPDVTITKKLTSPTLVGRSNSYDYPETFETQSSANSRPSPSKEFKTNFDRKLQTKHINENIVLRQPKKSEMTYFGINLSPKPMKKISQAVIRKESKLSDKPDLLQHYKKSPSPARNAAINKNKPRLRSPELVKGNNEPIYENLKEPKGRYGREFDSSILEQLTKAADQILQAVHGYTDEENHNKYSTDEEDAKNSRSEKLETISETKSWNQQQAQRTKSKPPNTRTKLKHTSSTSSVESLSRRRITSSSVERKSTITKTTLEHQRKKIEKSESTSSTAKANTKARRLQRASSREALLQSHGSSSEDLTANVEVPLRKPRLIKKTKAMQMTVTNGFELKKPMNGSTARRKDELPCKSEDRVLSSLPEIRHKTAVSTIRSTTDSSTRDRTRLRSEDLRKTPQKREGSRGTNPSSREREKGKSTALHKETVTHRISTANIKKCHRSDGGTKH